MKLIGAVSAIPGKARVLAKTLANDSVRGAEAIIELLHDGGEFVLFAVRRPEESTTDLVAGRSADGQDRFWFNGDSIEAVDRPAPQVDDVAAVASRLHQTLEGAFLGVRVDARQRVTLYGDSWGLAWIFIRKLRDAIVFGSDFGALTRAGGEALYLDRDTMLLEMAIGFTPDNRTVFSGIDVLPAGATLMLDASGAMQLSTQQPAYGDELAGASDAVKFAALDGHFERMGRRVARAAGGHAAISLSAGYDSRHALARLSMQDAVGPLLTFGEAESDEVVDAHAIALVHRSSPDWHSFPIPATRFDAWTRMIQSLGNAGIVQWCGWADEWLTFVRAHTPSCVIGYLGDALSGKRLNLLARQSALAAELDPAIPLEARQWIGFELDMGDWAQSALLRPQARQALLRIAADRFGTLSSAATYANGLQRALHCNLAGRQRRWVGTQPALMRSHIKPLNYFVDKGYRAFWMNVAPSDLVGQSLYLDYANARYPRFFPEPRGALRSFADRVSAKIASRARSLAGTPAPARRPPPVVRSRLLAPHFAEIRHTLDAASPWLEEYVDMAALRRGLDSLARGSSDGGLTTGMLIRSVNLAHLASLASLDTGNTRGAP